MGIGCPPPVRSPRCCRRPWSPTTLELDNEAEHRLAHRTTRHDDPDTEPSGPWLVSFALWANVLQYVERDGTTVAICAPGPVPISCSWVACAAGAMSRSPHPMVARCGTHRRTGRWCGPGRPAAGPWRSGPRSFAHR